MANTITVTQIDDELIFYAFQTDCSYELFHLRGYFSGFTVTLNIKEGKFQCCTEYINISEACTLTAYLPSGTYNICLVGINWGGPSNFNCSIGSSNYTYNDTSGTLGAVFSLPEGPVSITV